MIIILLVVDWYSILKKYYYFLLKVKSMPKFKNDDEAKAKKRADNERQLTIVMMVYIGINKMK